MNSALAYESCATQFLKARDRSDIGACVVRAWAENLAKSTEVLEIGCGGGYPVTRELVAADLRVWAIDSSATLLRTFRKRFPEVVTGCEKLQDSSFFDRKFDAAIAVGVVFLLPEDEQLRLLKRVASVLHPQGQFLFTAPVETGDWLDTNTGLQCRSIGVERYRFELSALGFESIESFTDRGGNHYYSCKYRE